MQIVALAVIVGAGLWLLWVGALMAIRPTRALRLLRRTATSTTANVVEQGLRMLGGVALIVRSPEAKLPDGFEIAGWFIAVSSAILLATPLRWHSGYARWWADRLPPGAVRAIGALSATLGSGLVYLAI